MQSNLVLEDFFSWQADLHIVMVTNIRHGYLSYSNVVKLMATDCVFVLCSMFFSIQLCGLTHCAFSLISKAGTVIDRDLLEETLPISWELLLDGDQQLVSAAGE